MKKSTKLDELKPDYLLLLNNTIPHIKNIHELNDIFEFNFSDNYQNMPYGLISSYYHANKSKFLEKKIGQNIDLDNHLFLAMCSDMLRTAKKTNILEEIYKITSDLFTLPISYQKKIVFIKMIPLEKQKLSLLDFFFNKLKYSAEEIVKNMSEEMEKIDASTKNTYKLIQMFIQDPNKNVRKKHLIKKIIEKLID
jgi:hypothetical protein